MMYPGYCAKYGAGKMFSLGIVFGIAAGAGCEAIIHGAEYVWGGALFGYFGGIALFAMITVEAARSAYSALLDAYPCNLPLARAEAHQTRL